MLGAFPAYSTVALMKVAALSSVFVQICTEIIGEMAMDSEAQTLFLDSVSNQNLQESNGVDFMGITKRLVSILNCFPIRQIGSLVNHVCVGDFASLVTRPLLNLLEVTHLLANSWL
jgi:hypothetical protein